MAGPRAAPHDRDVTCECLCVSITKVNIWSVELTERLCLDDAQLAQLNALALRCEKVYGPARDIEWAIAGGTLYLLQCRAVTRVG